MIRTLIGIVFLLLTVLSIPRRGDLAVNPGDSWGLLILPAVSAAIGLGLIYWGLRAILTKRLFKRVAIAFENAGKSDALGAVGESADRNQGIEPTARDNPTALSTQRQVTMSTAYGVRLSEGEDVVARLIPEAMNRLSRQLGQVAAVTDQRLFFVLPRPLFFVPRKGTSPTKSLWDNTTYSVESILLNEVLHVSHKKALAVGAGLWGVCLVSFAAVIAYEGITLALIGPGVVFIPLAAAPAGLLLIFGLRRRVIIFATKYGDLKWRSGPMEIGRTSLVVSKVRELMEARQIPVHGFAET